MSKESTQDTKQEFEIPKFNPERSPEEYDFGPLFINFYVHEPFLGAICSNIVRYEDWSIPTAYMAFDTKNMAFVLGYNPEFMASLGSKHIREWVIKHEIYHLILQHVSGRVNTDRRTRSLFNIAADLAVNSLFGKENMFEHALMPGIMPKNSKDPEAAKLIASFKQLESTEYYFEVLKKFAKDRAKSQCPICAAEKQKQQGKKSKNKQTGQNNSGASKDQTAKNDEEKNQDGNSGGENNQESHDHESDNEGSTNPGGSSPGGNGKESSGNENDSGEHGHEHGEGQLCDEHSDGEVEYTINIGGENGESLDSHDGWGEVPEDLKEIVNEKIKDMISEGVKRSQMKGSWGSIPASMQEYIQKLLTSEIDWKSVLRWFIGRARSLERDATIKKINKKAPYMFPGVKRKTTARLAFFIDQSGSMSNEDVQLAMSAAFECSRETEIDVYNFDTSVDEESHQVWKKNSNVEWSRTRSGGTDFNGVREFILKPENRNRWTGIAIVTDGYAPVMGFIPKVRVIWLITQNGTTEYVREGDLVIKMKEERTAKIKK